jgi:hypothetical protein
MTFGYEELRDKWYRDGWFSLRTCLDAFEAGTAEYGSTSVSIWWFEASHRRAGPKGQAFISCTAPC